MVREHDETGQFTQTVSHDDVLAVFEQVDGPVILTTDVAEAQDCTTQTARTKLKQLVDSGEVGTRRVANRTIYWQE
jgi:predicted transcriptional regulator